MLVSIALLIGAAGSAPIALPLLSPEKTISYMDRIGLRPREELERGGVLPMHLAPFFHAEAVLEGVEG